MLSIVNNPKSHHDARQRRSNADFDNSTDLECCETYLMRILSNPLSLKQQSRIVVRDRIIANMKHQQFVEKFVLSNPKYQLHSALEFNSPALSAAINANAMVTSIPNRRRQRTHSILECLYWQLDIPRILHFYLYAFPDIPAMPDTITTVFVND